MKVEFQKETCCGCEACYNICPVHAIEMKMDREGFYYPFVQEEVCIHCNKCVQVCLIEDKRERESLQKAYGCYANDEIEQMRSSSGGFFSVLSRYVIDNGGIVCGAAYNEEQMVYHKIVETHDELSQLKGTKYVQSRIGNVYSKIKEYLEIKPIVLFSGTPCEVVGLKNYLNREYDNLLCVDLICHGVPSSAIWKDYKEKFADGAKIKEVTFRNKNQGMESITIDYYLENGEVLKENYTESLYMKGFLQNLYVRPSCYKCEYKGKNHDSDLTIGDFWAVKEYYPEFNNGKGVSAVIAHTERGLKYFNHVKPQLKCVETSVEKIACWNENLLKPAKENPKRNDFYACWNDENLLEILPEFTKIEKKEKKKSSLIHVIDKIKRLFV